MQNIKAQRSKNILNGFYFDFCDCSLPILPFFVGCAELPVGPPCLFLSGVQQDVTSTNITKTADIYTQNEQTNKNAWVAYNKLRADMLGTAFSLRNKKSGKINMQLLTIISHINNNEIPVFFTCGKKLTCTIEKQNPGLNKSKKVAGKRSKLNEVIKQKRNKCSINNAKYMYLVVEGRGGCVICSRSPFFGFFCTAL